MKRMASITMTSLLLLVFGSNLDRSGTARAGSFGDTEVNFGFFYSSLRSYGQWIEAEPGFYVWRPFHISRNWRPYLHGRWVWSSYGWYWVSYEPFGWIVFHYGRWYYDDFYGWVWIPDYIWGPAWVEWRYNDDYIGWAPLPPYATFNISIGIRFTRVWRAPIHYWTFIPCRYITHRRYIDYVVPVERARRLLGSTRTSTYYRYDDGRIINRGVDVGFVERRANMRIKPADIVETRERGVERVVHDNGIERIEVYRPRRDDVHKEAPTRMEAHRSERRLSLDIRSIERDQRRAEMGRGETYQYESQPRPERQHYPAPDIRGDRDTRRTPVPEQRSEQREGEVRRSTNDRPAAVPRIERDRDRGRSPEPRIQPRSTEPSPAPPQRDQERQQRLRRSERPG